MERGAELFKDDILRGISLAIKNVSLKNFLYTFVLVREGQIFKKVILELVTWPNQYFSLRKLSSFYFLY